MLRQPGFPQARVRLLRGRSFRLSVVQELAAAISSFEPQKSRGGTRPKSVRRRALRAQSQFNSIFTVFSFSRLALGGQIREPYRLAAGFSGQLSIRPKHLKKMTRNSHTRSDMLRRGNPAAVRLARSAAISQRAAVARSRARSAGKVAGSPGQAPPCRGSKARRSAGAADRQSRHRDDRQGGRKIGRAAFSGTVSTMRRRTVPIRPYAVAGEHLVRQRYGTGRGSSLPFAAARRRRGRGRFCGRLVSPQVTCLPGPVATAPIVASVGHGQSQAPPAEHIRQR